MAADVEARLRVQLDALERSQVTMAEMLQATRRDFERRESALERRESDLLRRESDLVRTCELVAQTCARIVQSNEAERADRQAFLGAIRELVASVVASRAVEPTESSPQAERVLGGAVFASPVDIDLVSVSEANDSSDDANDDLAVEAFDPPDTPVEVRGRFDDDWVCGFQICGAVERNGVVQYQLRRTSDRSVLPKLFDAADVRSLDQPLPVRQLGLWTRA
jgi:hypothetical protein